MSGTHPSSDQTQNTPPGHSAIVVEGGAMRGIFAAGVLDAFMKNDYRPFQKAYGVSAGATNLIGYLAGDYGRNREIIMGHACQPDFIDWKRFAQGGHLCDVQWLWQQSYSDVPLSLDNYLAGSTELWVVTTSVETGEARYFRLDENNMHEVLTASCAIPIAYRDYPLVNGEAMTDGGVADSIPVIKAYEDGARDITVVLSRQLGYRKKPPRFTFVPKALFKEYPALSETTLNRSQRYNETLDFILDPPLDCTMRVIAPPQDFAVGRLTRNHETLETGYQQGYEAGMVHLNEESPAAS